MSDLLTLRAILDRAGIKYYVSGFQIETPRWETREVKRPDGTAHRVEVRVPGHFRNAITVEVAHDYDNGVTFRFSDDGALESVYGWGI